MSIAAFVLSFLVALAGLVLGVVGVTRTGRGRRRGRGLAVAAIAIATLNIVLGIVVLARYASSSPFRGSDGDDLAVGDCVEEFLEDGGTTEQVPNVPVVACTEPHVYEVFHEFTVEGGAWPGVDDLRQRASAVCVDLLGTRLEQAGQEPAEFDLAALWPSRTTWDTGDRSITCLLYRADGLPITGPVLGPSGSAAAAGS